ncbi:hypothetical protein CC80DRAFT_594384 [Byssothecium circinans]|uniref:Aminoglycoside phosphotransferase domain-containing protein n=1 Tax=Byssothecium circinans TaxID=147558 RepID=A0A6A5TU63_9PLEO|nr:hypothetical protein CC80DRAFT_594384 [Byssothecium circinans]
MVVRHSWASAHASETSHVGSSKNRWTVYLAIPVEDPQELYKGINEAVIKVKFQIRASSEVMRENESWLRENEISLLHHPDSAATKAEIERMRSYLHFGIMPAKIANRDTTDEIHALRLLDDGESSHTPRLWGFLATTVKQRGNHFEEIVGGYFCFMLMSKVPGKRIEYDWYWALSKEERDEIREAFKVALLEVWDNGIEPHDTGLHNLMWDDEERKCYILDFEDCTFFNEEEGAREPKWTDDEWKRWRLAEREPKA